MDGGRDSPPHLLLRSPRRPTDDRVRLLSDSGHGQLVWGKKRQNLMNWLRWLCRRKKKTCNIILIGHSVGVELTILGVLGFKFAGKGILAVIDTMKLIHEGFGLWAGYLREQLLLESCSCPFSQLRTTHYLLAGGAWCPGSYMAPFLQRRLCVMNYKTNVVLMYSPNSHSFFFSFARSRKHAQGGITSQHISKHSEPLNRIRRHEGGRVVADCNVACMPRNPGA